MKKYLILTALFFFASFPVLAKGSTNTGGQPQTTQGSQTVTNAQKMISPTGNTVKNQNQVQTQETENLNQEVDDNIQKVSTQVQELLDTVGAKTGIGSKIKVIAQNQQQTQAKIKTSYEQLKNRGQLVRLFVGSDKKMTQALEELTQENKLRIEELEQLKAQTNNQTDLNQLQETIDLMLYQNTSLGEKIAKEKQINGILGWFTRLFNRQ